MLIHTSQVCDGVIDCSDLSDECLCTGETRLDICSQVIPYGSKIATDGDVPGEDGLDENWEASKVNDSWSSESAANQSHCVPGGIECKPGMCIPRSSVCDGVIDCDNDERSKFCEGTIGCQYATKKGEQCRCINDVLCSAHYGKACDGIPDCPMDLPSGSSVQDGESFAEDECDAVCHNASNHTCSDGFVTYLTDMVGALPCSLTEDYYIDIKSFCDGKKDCPHGEDENCSERFKCDGVRPDFISIRHDQVCDGIIDCKNGADESRERCQGERFFCDTLGGRKVNIEKSRRCDFIITCDDGADEENCTDSRFYCENGKPLFVKERQKFDGRGDCSDWSDECPKLNQSGATDGFSSRYELIANPVLRVLVWVMGLLSICGNATVLFVGVKQLKESKKPAAMALTNRLLVLNLATSDILMGVYLISLGIAGLTMSGHYCSQKLQWRTSSTCKTLGVLSVLSSETSVITMVYMAGCRLYAVLKPFKASTRPRKRVVGLMIISSWAVSLAIALVPLAPELSGTFVSHSQFKDAPYLRNIETSLDEARQLFRWLMTYDFKQNVTIPVGLSEENFDWYKLEEESAKLFLHERMRIERMFGYYSTQSVCIPKFFVTTSSKAWGFSFFVNLLNFVSFIFVASSYVTIYFQSSRHADIRSSGGDRNEAMQRKILRLVATDFCCWMPISILAFLKLGGVDISNIAYVVSGIVLLPINSASNPLLYSDLPELIVEKVTCKKNWARCLSVCPNSTMVNESKRTEVTEATM